MKRKATVTILQRRLVQYRVSMFERLRAECANEGIELRVVYGEPSPTDAKRNDGGELAWGDEVRSRWYDVAGIEVLWQACPREARRCDLLVLTQESKILSNYPFLLARAVGRRFGAKRRVAYWGHGRNLQSTRPDGFRERWKQLLVSRVDWWFAYNNHTKTMLTEQGFPAHRITCLENAIDNEAFADDLAAVPPEMLRRLREEIDLAPGAPLGLYCGALYGDKRIDALVAVADAVHRADPSFRLVVVGDGPVRPELVALLEDKPWARCVGARYGIEKAAWFRLAAVQISPGAVGLHVLDSFVAGVPLFTSLAAAHGPEVDYLEHGRNGFLLDDDPAAHAEAIIELLADPKRYTAVVEAGLKDADHYTVANMISNFTNGIIECLDSDD